MDDSLRDWSTRTPTFTRFLDAIRARVHYFVDFSNSRYLTTVCAVGNWNSCKISDTFSGHYIGYPFLIALTSRLLGFNPMIGSYLSLSASLIAVVLIFLVGELIDPGGFVGLAGSLVFCLTPVFAVQGVGTYESQFPTLLL